MLLLNKVTIIYFTTIHHVLFTSINNKLFIRIFNYYKDLEELLHRGNWQKRYPGKVKTLVRVQPVLYMVHPFINSCNKIILNLNHEIKSRARLGTTAQILSL